MTGKTRNGRIYRMRVIGAPTRAIANRFGISIADVNAVDVKLDNGYQVRTVTLDLEPLEEIKTRSPTILTLNKTRLNNGTAVRGVGSNAATAIA